MYKSMVLGFMAFGILMPAVSGQDKTWKAGAAKIIITPPELMWMSGYGARDKPAEGKLTELWAKALVLQDPSGRKSVLVTMDLVGISRDLSISVSKDIRDKYSLEREAIILSVSHTHCGPVIRNNLNTMYNLDPKQQRLVLNYKHFLQDKLIRVVGEAIEKLGPARLSWGIGQTDFAVNRRNNKEADVPRLKEGGMLKGPVDHDVPVLAVHDAKNRLQAVAFGYACHATVLSFYQWCGDYPGFAQEDLEKAHPEAVALFWAGCGADQNPLPRRSVPLAQKYGKQLADAVHEVLKKPLRPVEGNLTYSYKEIDLRLAELPTREALAKDALSANRFIAARAKMLLEELAQKGSLLSSYPYPVQAWGLGRDLELVTLGGEVVVDFSLRLKKELNPSSPRGEGRVRGVWVMGYANDVMAYIPSLRVLKEGGYEGGGAMIYYGLPTVWSPRVEEDIVAAVHEQIRKIRSSGK